MHKLGSGWSTSSDFHFYRRTKLAMHLLTSWLTLPRTHRAKPSLTICWTLCFVLNPACLCCHSLINVCVMNTYVAPDSRFPPTLWASAPTAEELPLTNNGCESFHSHLSKSFSGPHPNIYHFSNALLLYQTNAYIQLQNIVSRKLVKIQEETRRNFIRRTWASYTTCQISRKDYMCKMCYKFLPVL